MRRSRGKAPTGRFLPSIAAMRFSRRSCRRQVDADEWLQQNYAELFERQLEPWTTDEGQWPPDRSFDTFLAWFDVVFAPTSRRHPGPGPSLPGAARATCDPLSLRQVLAEFLQLPADGSLHVDIGDRRAVRVDRRRAGGDSRRRRGSARRRSRRHARSCRRPSHPSRSSRSRIVRTSTTIDAMVTFASSVESPTIRNRLLGALQGKKARRRFTRGDRGRGTSSSLVCVASSAWPRKPCAILGRARRAVRGRPGREREDGNTKTTGRRVMWSRDSAPAAG